jgi:WD40 repeat protein
LCFATRTIPSFPEPAGPVAVSPDERLCLSLGWHGDVCFRNLVDQSGTKQDLGGRHWASSADFSPDGKLLAVLTHDSFARVYSTATWRPEVTLSGFLGGNTYSIAFALDGKRLTATNRRKQAVMLWDTESWQEVLALEGAEPVRARFSPDGNSIGASDAAGNLQLRQAPSWEEIAATEAKDPPSQGYGGQDGGQGRPEIKQP